MFAIDQIDSAHSKVKSGAEFPKYIQEIKEMGVIAFETRVMDSVTRYFGENGFTTVSKAKYEALGIAADCDKERFIHCLKRHQQGETDYFTFCRNCAETGIEKWVVDLHQMTCAYYDKSGNEILVEVVPVI